MGLLWIEVLKRETDRKYLQLDVIEKRALCEDQS
jgi:hypothetical protein